MSESQISSLDQIILSAYQLLEEFEYTFKSNSSAQINEQKEELKNDYNRWHNDALEILIDTGFSPSFILKFKNTRSTSPMYREGNAMIQNYIKDLHAKIAIVEQKQAEFVRQNSPVNASVIIHGGYQNLAINTNGNVSQEFTINNDFETLRQALLKYGVESGDIDELREIVKSEKPNGTSLGVHAKAWVSKISMKLAGAGLSVGADLLARSLLAHYGITL